MLDVWLQWPFRIVVDQGSQTMICATKEKAPDIL